MRCICRREAVSRSILLICSLLFANGRLPCPIPYIPKTPRSVSSHRPLRSLSILFPIISPRPIFLPMLIHTRKRPASLRLRCRQELPIPDRRPQRQSHLIIFTRIRISALKLAEFHRGAVFARGCDAEVFFAETGAE